MTNDSSPTAALLLIGNELLSGRTQDKNLAFIGERLAARGIVLAEARVIADVPEVIISTVNTLRDQFTFVFTTGGIGPTHDDITADCVAKAFGVELPTHPEAEQRLLAYFEERSIEANTDRMRMARIPVGGKLIDNPVSVAPGFSIENVFVMAGVPRIMQAMFENIEPSLPLGQRFDSVTVLCNLGEGTFAGALRELQEKYAQLDLGSYPISAEKGLRVALVAKGQDKNALADAGADMQSMVAQLGGQIFEN